MILYAGERCEIPERQQELDPCDSVFCRNGGACISLSSTTGHCVCLNGYTGTLYTLVLQCIQAIVSIFAVNICSIYITLNHFKFNNCKIVKGCLGRSPQPGQVSCTRTGLMHKDMKQDKAFRPTDSSQAIKVDCMSWLDSPNAFTIYRCPIFVITNRVQFFFNKLDQILFQDINN